MNTKRAYQVIQRVIDTFDLTDQLGPALKVASGDEEALCVIAESVGMTREDLRSGISPIPDALHKQYPLFDMLSSWNFSKLMTGKYGSLRVLGKIFGSKAALPDLPTEEEEAEMLKDSVRARCDKKVCQINEIFPGTYPLELPVASFTLRTNELITFRQVYEMSDAFDAVIARFSRLFFASVQGDLPQREVCELNLLATFLQAMDAVEIITPISYQHIQERREQIRDEGYHELESYVRICRVIPFWKARDFYQDAGRIAKYIETHHDAKATIRSFLTMVTAYECTYTFIKDRATYQRFQAMTEEELNEYCYESVMSGCDEDESLYENSEPILVPKEDGEIAEKDRLIAERGFQILKNIHCTYRPKEPEARNIALRIMKRYGMPTDATTQEDAADGDDLIDFEITEEGDFNE